jgi:hypothetical protein
MGREQIKLANSFAIPAHIGSHSTAEDTQWNPHPGFVRRLMPEP